MILPQYFFKVVLFFVLTFALPVLASAQSVKLKFGDIVLGSETTTLVANGGFETNGGNGSTSATGWAQSGQMRVTSDNVGGLVPNYDGGNFVAKAHVTPFTINGLYTRNVVLSANTEYVLSAYIWNLSVPNDPARRWNVNVDVNGQNRIAVLGTDIDGDQGYFVHSTFPAIRVRLDI